MKSEQDQRYAKQFGEFIRTARESRGLYQEDVAKLMGVSGAYISAFELGKRSIDLGMAMRLCNILNVDLNDFIQQHRN